MSLQSVKTRFVGSYVFLLVLFVIQIPIVFVLVAGMTEKYSQIDTAGGLRKRAVEITDILNRHIMTGDESLEALYQKRKGEYQGVIDNFRSGTATLTALDNTEISAQLKVVENKWGDMRSTLDETMVNGDNMREAKQSVESSTFPLVAKLNTLIAAEKASGSSAVKGFVDPTGFQRMRTVKLSYLMERYILATDEAPALKAEVEKTIAGFDSSLSELGSVVAANSSGANGAKLNDAFKAVSSAWDSRKIDVREALRFNDAFASNIESLIHEHTPEVVAAANEFTKLISANANHEAMGGVKLMAVSVAISAIVAAFFMWSANTMIIRPIVRIKETVERFAHGDLTDRSRVKISLFGREIKDEVSALGDSVDEMANSMSDVLGRISDSSNLLASSSEQLSASATEIENGTNQQSAQTAQVATAMEEMSATVIEVAKNSQQVSESARVAQDTAAEGGNIVRETISAMQEVSESTTSTAETIGKLGESSEEIGTIISVINDIADQTNLLALNAAIEAARAGEQGRGFAVVADEVRKLAERTTTATKEIGSMISSIQTETSTAVEAMGEGIKKVDNGVRLANETGEALAKIVDGVQSVSDMVNQIATATEEQSATADEISRSMDSISDVSRSNVNAIGEVSGATGETARLASELKELVGNFKINDGSGVTHSSSELRLVSNSTKPAGQQSDAGLSSDDPHHNVGNL
ncbi:MAG: methyl-accepting chemotaxis protein [Proteobacteria bacterium]|nr:methyl-accepting chemotaxis protein [Pseudomonadota bacterium]